jgi:hypothetical protein
VELFGKALIVALAAVLYFLPTVVAVRRRHVSKLGIFLINLFFGWTFVGWLAAMLWAVNADVRPRAA